MTIKAQPKSDWIHSNELLLHLCLCPWLKFPETFDTTPGLLEAQRVKDEFVTAQEDRQFSKTGELGWRVLGLRTHNGAAVNTRHYQSYGLGKENFQMTNVVDRSPQMVSIINRFVNFEQAQRTLIAKLDPGCGLSSHVDSVYLQIPISVNIALNMPDGCEFWVDLNPDGSKNKYSHQIPFGAGSAIIFNGSSYHSVLNNSDISRYHIIARGPLKVHETKLLEIARNQNQVSDLDELRAKVREKYRYLKDIYTSFSDVEVVNLS